MNLQAFKKSLTAPKPVYVLRSSDSYLCKKVLEVCQEQVDEAARTFDWALFDLADDAEQDVINTARTLPWMSPVRWVYVKNVPSGTEELVEYSKRPSEKAVLVLELKKMVGKLAKLPRIEMSSKADSRWIQDRVKREGYRIDPTATEMLLELTGDEIEQLEANLERLFILNLDSRKIDAPSVSEMVFQTREFGMFDLIPAMASKNTSRALSIIGSMFDTGMAVQQINWMLCWNYRRLVVARELLERRRPFFEIVKLLKMYSYKDKEKEIRKIPRRDFEKVLIGLRDADRLSKTTKGDPRGLLERLIVDTCRTDSV